MEGVHLHVQFRFTNRQLSLKRHLQHFSDQYSESAFAFAFWIYIQNITCSKHLFELESEVFSIYILPFTFLDLFSMKNWPFKHLSELCSGGPYTFTLNSHPIKLTLKTFFWTWVRGFKHLHFTFYIFWICFPEKMAL